METLPVAGVIRLRARPPLLKSSFVERVGDCNEWQQRISGNDHFDRNMFRAYVPDIRPSGFFLKRWHECSKIERKPKGVMLF